MWKQAMPREDARSKGIRYLAEGRLLVTTVTDRVVVARCRGGGEVYHLTGRSLRSELQLPSPHRALFAPDYAPLGDGSALGSGLAWCERGRAPVTGQGG